MPPVNRAGPDVSTGHLTFPPIGTSAGSGTVFVNGSPAMRLGDPYLSHSEVSTGGGTHNGTEASGSGTVFADGLPINRVGDPISCGGFNATGSPNVFAGG